MEFLRSTTDAIGNLDLENPDGVVADHEHDRVWNGYLNQDFALAGGLLPGTTAQLRTLQSRRDDRRLFYGGAGVHALW